MDILYDWQFWGVVIALLTFISGFVIYQLGRSKKRLAYSVLTETPLLSVDETIKGKIEIKYEKKKIQNIYLVTLKIENIGNVDIASSDFEQPVIFSFLDSEIISAEIIDVSPKNMKPLIIIENKGVKLTPILLNKNDSITMKLLFLKYEKKLKLMQELLG